MGDMSLLKAKIVESGYKMGHIASVANMDRGSLFNKIKGKHEFKASEIDALTKLLNLTRNERDKIFFCPDSELNSQNTI